MLWFIFFIIFEYVLIIRSFQNVITLIIYMS